jgi:hypothetical protein
MEEDSKPVGGAAGREIVGEWLANGEAVGGAGLESV